MSGETGQDMLCDSSHISPQEAVCVRHADDAPGERRRLSRVQLESSCSPEEKDLSEIRTCFFRLIPTLQTFKSISIHKVKCTIGKPEKKCNVQFLHLLSIG